jgi:hypothetical protein
MRNWLFRETRNFVKRRVSFAKQRNSFRIVFRETKSETSFAGNPTYTVFRITATIEIRSWFRRKSSFGAAGIGTIWRPLKESK